MGTGMGGGSPYMPTYNSIASRGRIAPLGGPAGALTPPEESSLADGAMGGFFDHMLEGMKEPTKQEKIDQLLIARDVALGRVEKEEARKKELKLKAPLLAADDWSTFNQRKVEGRMPAFETWQGPDAKSFWADGDLSKIMRGTDLQTELLYIDAELKRLTGKSGYSNRGEPFVPERSHVPSNSIFYQDNLTSTSGNEVGGFLKSIFNGIKGT